MSLMRRARPITSVVGYNTSLLYRLIRLSLPKGEGRVRVYGFDLDTDSEPLTSVLSPCSKGRGEREHGDFV